MSRSPTPDPEPVTLEEAIVNSHPERILETLIAVCEKSAEAKTIVSGLLLSDIKPEAVKDAAQKEKLQGKKRKRWEACDQCDEEYDVEDNKDGSCHFHDGEVEKDDSHDLWKSDEAASDAAVDEIADMVPEAVRWTCCKKAGDSEGCKTGKHRVASPEKIARLQELMNGEESDDDDDDEDDKA